MSSSSLSEKPVLRPYPNDPGARSYIGGESTTLYFINDLPSGLQAIISQIDCQGHRKRWAKVKSGPSSEGWEYRETTAYLLRPWEVTFCKGETETETETETVATWIYYPMPDPSCIVLDPDESPVQYLTGVSESFVRNVSSPEGGASTTIKFENRLQVKVNIFCLDSVGKPIPYGSINPRDSSLQHTRVDHAWKVVAEYEVPSFVVFYATPHGGIARIESSLFSGHISG
ncbi:hypothetical protein E4T56_gene13846 [Termitomyces sp. T112]|nr:hypothetical protein E4T56_gene13846 [Termitomyces sp. T112]KAH0588540.1 hypothetical protein H2248_004369 [Termitomyces sp. 'cryptogamus']